MMMILEHTRLSALNYWSTADSTRVSGNRGTFSLTVSRKEGS